MTRRTVLQALVLSHVARGTTTWALGVGSLALVLRAGLGADTRAALLAGLATAPAVLCWALWRASRHLPSRGALLAYLDDRNGLGGLAAAAAEVDLGPWASRPAAEQRVEAHWKGRTGLARMAAALVFTVAGLWLPVAHEGGAVEPLDLGREVAEIQTAIEAAKLAEVLDADRAREMVAVLEELRQGSASSEPARAFETLDRVAQELEQVGEEAAEDLLTTAERLTWAEALTEALRSADAGLAPGRLAELSRTLAEAARALELDRELSRALDKAAAEGALPAELLEPLAEALERSRAELDAQVVRLAKARLVSAELVRQCSGSGCDRADGLLAFLAADGDRPVGEALVLCTAPTGRGEIDRGRGDAPLLTTDGTDLTGTRFEAQVLPPSDLAALRQARRVGLSAAVPESLHASPSDVRALTGTAYSGGSAVRRQILPRHREVVRRYFDRPQEEP